MSGLTKLPKPQMRRLFETQLKLQLGFALTSGVISAVLFKIFYAEKRKQRVIDYYKDYDCEVHFEKMRRNGVFDSVPAD
ncbi:cytochrome c oxidase subunit 6C-like [Lycorma delicatula]|uniref:cytochrome c oxidase subunit 6C-like n=1 Tax=Lycorma delicatula TaxID=130591 RepID=UPI003F5117E1